MDGRIKFSRRLICVVNDTGELLKHRGAFESRLLLLCGGTQRDNMSYMEDLVGQPGGGTVVPGHEGELCRVSADAVRAADELSPSRQEEDVQGLLHSSTEHALHLRHTNHGSMNGRTDEWMHEWVNL